MKLITIVNANNVIEGLADKEDVGARLAYWMTKFVAVTQSDMDFYRKEMQKLFDKYGTKNDNGDLVVPNDKIEEFSKSVQEIQDTDAKDPEIRFALSDLTDTLKLSIKQMYPLLDFIDENK